MPWSSPLPWRSGTIGANHELLAVAVIVGWFAAPALAVRIVRVFHANEFAGSSTPMVVAIMVFVWIALMLWNAGIAPLIGFDCQGLLRCPLGAVAASQLSQAAVIFLASFGAASLVASFQTRPSASNRP